MRTHLPPEAFVEKKTYELELAGQEGVSLGTFRRFKIDKRGCWMFFDVVNNHGQKLTSINYKHIVRAIG